MQCNSLESLQHVEFPIVKIKNLRHETALEMREDTQKDNAYFTKKKKGERKTKMMQTN